MEFLLRAMLQGVAFWAFPILIALLLWKRHTIAGVIRATGRLVWRRKFVVAGALAILVAGFIGLVSFLDYQEDLARHARYAARQDRARADFKVYQERKAAGASRRPCEITIFGTPESACRPD
ncbi:MAG: hypothetical protein IH905_11950 [Proteobacteria bacterium]|nr:hypothetical protein [Pseudomonadota bacterium]